MWKKYSAPTKNTKSFIPSGRQNKLRVPAICLVIAILMAVVSGCGAPADQEPLVVPTPVPTPAPAQGGELRLPMPVNPDLTDPLKVNTEEMHLLFSLVFEGLVRCDNTNLIVPGLAENWSVDESGRTWTFNLRKGVRWHNSDTFFTAWDVKYTLDRLSAMEEGYYSYVPETVESYSVIDDNTIRITMREAGMSQLYSLIFPVMRSSEGTGELPSGTGPYQFVDYDSREGIVTLSVNPKWWRQTAYISTIVFESRANNETALASYAAGQLNMVPTSSLSVGKYREEGVTTVLDVMTQQAELVLVNHKSSILGDIRVRQAIACGIDRNELIANIYMYRAMPVDVPVAPDSWAYESKSKIYDYNPARAKTLLEEAGWVDSDGDGILEHQLRGSRELSLTLLVNETTDVNARRDAANLIAEQLLELGIRVTVETEPFSLGNGNSTYISRLKNGDFDLALAGFNLSRSGDMRPFIDPAGAHNYGSFSDETLSKLAKTLVNAADEKEYRDAASAFQLEFAQQLPCIMLYFRYNSIVYSNDIMGVQEIREPDIFRNIERWYMQTE